MFERFTKDARAVTIRAQQEARALGSPTIEAEHLLLALADRSGGVLAEAGLDREGVRAALDAEAERSLAAAGVAWDVPSPVIASAAPRFATSSKLALERALRAAVERGDRRLTADHVLLGILRAEVGTVPRALAIAGIDRAALAARIGS
jgi:ATP-dependent Clp protease ATP-binding subunit ClpA